MANPICMPRLGMTMEEGTVVNWPLSVGDPVEKGQLVLIIESEKAEVEVEAQASGIFRHVFIDEGETVPCGVVLAAITDTADEEFDAEAFRVAEDRSEASADSAEESAAPEPAAPAAAPAAGRSKRPAATPAARSLAKKHGLELEGIAGSGPGGRITREDIEELMERRAGLVAVADGVHLDVPSEGEGDPVLLVPGFGTDLSAFARQVPALAESFQVRGVHPRGIALSDAPAQDEYGVPQAAADLLAVEEKPFHLVGASWGAGVALEAALSAPERVRSLTLITPVVTASPRLLSWIEAWCRLSAEASSDALASALLPWPFSDAFLADRAARERTRRGLAATVAKAPAATLERVAAGLESWSGSRRPCRPHR